MNGEDQILFERFLDNALTPDELDAFNQRIESDADFKEAFEIFQQMQSFLGEKTAKSEALDILREVHDEKTAKASKPMLYYVAATLLIIIAFALLYTLKNLNKAADRSNFAEILVEASWPESRGTTSELESLVIQYRADKDPNTLDRIKNSPSIHSFSKYYWLSEIYIHEQNADSALEYIKRSQQLSMGIYRDRLIYLEALAYFLKEDARALKSLQEKLPADMDEYYRERVLDIII